MTTTYIVFIDSEQSIALHVAPIRMLSINSVILICDSKDVTMASTAENVRAVIDSLETDCEMVYIDIFNYIHSILEMYSNRDIIFSDNAAEIVINASSNYLPGVLALANICLILNKEFSFLTLFRDSSGNWKNKKWTNFFPFFSLKPCIDDKHLNFLNILYNAEKREFYIEDLIDIIQVLGLINDLDLSKDQEMNIARKRLYDLEKPLIELKILKREKVNKKSVYSLIEV